MKITLYGIANCDTVKKAKQWLNNSALSFEFHDFRKDGLSREWLQQAVSALTWEAMLNKRGTTFRNLNDEDKQNLDEAKAIELMLTYPAMIKRPVLIADGHYHVGFKPSDYEAIFA